MTSEEFLELCKKGSPAQIKEALEAGADPNAQDGDGESALIAAILYNSDADSADIIELLLRSGADVNAQIRDDSFDIMDTALECAIRFGNIEAVSALLKGGADVHARDKYGMTPLHNALSGGSPNGLETAALLLKAGADVNAQDEKGRTALHYASWGTADPEVVALLLKAGADATLKDKSGYTAEVRPGTSKKG